MFSSDVLPFRTNVSLFGTGVSQCLVPASRSDWYGVSVFDTGVSGFGTGLSVFGTGLSQCFAPVSLGVCTVRVWCL